MTSDKYSLTVAAYGYNSGMPEVRSELARNLAALRVRYKVPMKELARALGSKHASGWQYYETDVTGPYLKAEVAEKIAPVFEEHGCNPAEIWRLVAPSVEGAVPGDAVSMKLVRDQVAKAMRDTYERLGKPISEADLADFVADYLRNRLHIDADSPTLPHIPVHPSRSK